MRVPTALLTIAATGFAAISLAPRLAAADESGFVTHFDSLSHRQWFVSDGWANGDYQSCEWRAANVVAKDGNLNLILADNGGRQRPIGCAELRTNKRYGYGLYEARMKMAAGSGLNSAFFTYIGPPNGVPEWDEIDFEFLGKDTHAVQTNYYTNGKSMGGVVVPLAYDASQEFHNYAIDWEAAKIRWYVDGKLVHETPDGAALPHNPSAIFLSLWSGARQEDGWMGPFTYQQPVAAAVSWVAYTPPGESCAFPESMSCK